MNRAVAIRAGIYACLWFVVAWQCLRGGRGDPGDHLALAVGISLIQGALAALLASTPPWVRLPGLALYIPVAAVLLLLLLFHGLFINSGGLISSDAMRAVAQTDPAEAFAYLRRLISPAEVAIALAIALLLAVAFPRARAARAGLIANVALLSVAAVGVLTAHVAAIPVFAPVQAYVSQYREERSAFLSMLETRKTRPVSEALSDFRGTVIVVIGESITRRHMGRYGYFRDTTPRLDARASQWILLADVNSPHSHSVPALTGALTTAGTEGRRAPASEDTDIVSLALGAGFRTHWLSNQNQFGVWDNSITAIAELADDRRFFSTELGTSFSRSVLDHDMLPALEEIVRAPHPARKLAFVHLFTNHWPYCTNYGAEFRYFQGALGAKFFGTAPEPKDVNCYDNGIRYADWLVDRIVAVAEKADGPAAVLYFSDHGEAPLLGTGHDSSRHSSYHIEIPFMVWANETFTRSYSDKLAAARANSGRPYSTARLYHSLADILDIRHSSVEMRHSVFSTELVDVRRDSLGGTIALDRWAPANDVRENAAANVSALGPRRAAVWAHRVNTIGTLVESAAIFDGVEMDLVFIDAERCFHVYHPPARDVSLSLKEMLEAAARRPALKLWLDWKNATPENIHEATRCLLDLDRRFNLRARSLVETGPTAVFPETKRLSDAGFEHAYYLPTEKVAACMKSCGEEGERELAGVLRKTLEAGGYKALTFDWNLKPYVKRWLAEWAGERGMALYGWDLSINASTDPAAPAAIEERFRELNLKALLVTFPSPFRR